MITTKTHNSLPKLTSAQMAEVDRLMIEEYGIELLQMMENAGRLCGRLARERFLAGSVRSKRVAVVAGPGGNGGGAMAAARYLHNWGAEVSVVHPGSLAKFKPATRKQHDILRRLHIKGYSSENIDQIGAASLIIDGLIGYSLRGTPRLEEAALIAWMNGTRIPVLSLDIPSGVDATTGETPGIAVKAAATLTLALPKTGLYEPRGRAHSGQLFLADIGVPPKLYSAIRVDVDAIRNLFSENEIEALT